MCRNHLYNKGVHATCVSVNTKYIHLPASVCVRVCVRTSKSERELSSSCMHFYAHVPKASKPGANPTRAWRFLSRDLIFPCHAPKMILTHGPKARCRARCNLDGKVSCNRSCHMSSLALCGKKGSKCQTNTCGQTQTRAYSNMPKVEVNQWAERG